MLTTSIQNSTPFVFQRLLWTNYLMQKTTIMTYKRSPKSRTKCTNNDTRRTTAPRKPNIVSSMPRLFTLTQLPWMQPRSRLLHRLPNLNSRPIRQRQKMSQRRHQERQSMKGQHRHRLYAHHPLPLALRHRHRHPHPRSVTNLRGR
jgi:hypothetical protein